MAAGALNKTISYTENVPNDIGYSSALSGGTGTVRVEIYPSVASTTYYGRLITGIFTTTASVWRVEDQKWICEGTQAEVNAALNYLTFEPADNITNDFTYTVDVYENDSTSATLGHPSSIVMDGSVLVPSPSLSTYGATDTTYTTASRTTLSFPTISHPNNQIIQVDLKLKRHSNDATGREYPDRMGGGYIVTNQTDTVDPASATFSTGLSQDAVDQTHPVTGYGYLDTRIQVGNKKPTANSIGGLQIIATVAECNELLRFIQYVSPADTNFNPTLYVEMTVSDGTNEL